MALYPPYIEGKIPAQTGTTLAIPYQDNRAYSSTNLIAKIKTINTGKVIGTLTGEGNDNKLADFSISDDLLLTVGQYYKIQLAYDDNDNNSEKIYSTVGIFKYTANPEVLIESEADNIYIGSFQSADKTEKLDSYCFELYKGNILIETSGWKVHNSDTDIGDIQYDRFVLNNIITESSYTLKYKVKTINGLEVTSENFTITTSYTEDISFDFMVQNNKDDGVVILTRTNDENNSYTVLRSEDEIHWQVINVTNDIEIKDFTIEQGKTYYYALSWRDNSEKNYILYANAPVYADFEDAFLYDGKRQLKLRFNPKVTSFKDTILEAKLDTIGGTYPFIFRNSNVKYKELPIQGMISLLMDDNGYFVESPAQAPSIRPGTNATESSVLADLPHNLTSNNIYNERMFKLEVLEWLNNGKPKLFRSPTEGNYLLRLMNVSLTPNDTLGRMLHSFSATGYEIAEINTQNLQKYNIIGTEER